MKNKKQRGVIAVDFLFAFVLVSGFAFALLSLTLTLTVVELTQYITYSSARSFMAGHISYVEQTKLGQAKYSELVTNPIFSPLYKNGWFIIQDDKANIGDHENEAPFEVIQYPPKGDEPNNFWGTSTSFTAKVLNFRVPLYGSTTDNDGKGAFISYIGSYLGREPSQSECEGSFVKNRWKQLRNIIGSAVKTYTKEDGYHSFTDNGC